MQCSLKTVIFILLFLFIASPSNALGYHDRWPWGAEAWQGRVWMPEYVHKFGFGKRAKWDVRMLSCDDRGRCHGAFTVRGLDEVSLVPAPDRLWLVSETSIGFYSRGKYHRIPNVKIQRDDGAMVLPNGTLASVRHDENNIKISSLHGTRWVVEKNYSKAQGDIDFNRIKFRSILINNKPYVFSWTSINHSVYYHAGIPQGKILDVKKSYRRIATCNGEVEFVSWGDDSPTLLCFDDRITGYTIGDGDSRKIFSTQQICSQKVFLSPKLCSNPIVKFYFENILAAFRVANVSDKSMVLVTDTFLGRIRFQHIQDGMLVSTAVSGTPVPMYLFMYSALLMFMISILAFVVNAIIARINPLWYYTWGFRNVQTRLVHKPARTVHEILDAPCTGLSTIIVRTWPKHSAVTLRPSLLLNRYTLPSAVLFLEEQKHDLRVTLVSNYPVSTYIMCLMLPVIAAPFVSIIFRYFIDFQQAFIASALFLAVSFVFWQMRWRATRSTREARVQRFFDLLLSAAGLNPLEEHK